MFGCTSARNWYLFLFHCRLVVDDHPSSHHPGERAAVPSREAIQQSAIAWKKGLATACEEERTESRPRKRGSAPPSEWKGVAAARRSGKGGAAAEATPYGPRRLRGTQWW
jgi:hypothetical protein